MRAEGGIEGWRWREKTALGGRKSSSPLSLPLSHQTPTDLNAISHGIDALDELLAGLVLEVHDLGGGLDHAHHMRATVRGGLGLGLGPPPD